MKPTFAMYSYLFQEPYSFPESSTIVRQYLSTGWPKHPTKIQQTCIKFWHLSANSSFRVWSSVFAFWISSNSFLCFAKSSVFSDRLPFNSLIVWKIEIISGVSKPKISRREHFKPKFLSRSSFELNWAIMEPSHFWAYVTALFFPYWYLP